MNSPNFIVKLNQKLDFEISEEFLGLFSELKIDNKSPVTTKRELKEVFNFYYNEHPERLNKMKDALESKQSTLCQIAGIISEKLKYPWDGIEAITIVPALCPLAPRFIKDSMFMLPFYANENWALKVCAHEMTHFLYFKKLQYQLKKPVETEQPSLDWLISEIVAPIIVNSDPMQAIVKEKDSFYSPQGSNISNTKIKEIQQLFIENDDIVEFRKKAIKKIG